MTHLKKPPSKIPSNRVNWQDPRLEALLKKSQDWQLDNRGNHPSLEVEIHLGWSASATRKALLVWELADVMVLETDFAIATGEHVRVDKPFGDGYQTRWGTVAESRPGLRADDRESGTQVHWIHLR